ncbi:MAG: 3-phosphoshikimate 1-carboxyvinyltransferase [bacterium]
MDLIVRNCKKVDGIIAVGGDKSITHRSLIIASIAQSETEIHNYSEADDCFSTLKCMRRLGVDIEVDKNTIFVKGRGIDGLSEPDDILDCGNSGTTMRLLTGLLAGQKFYTVLNGDDSLRKRPMGRVIEPLSLMGAVIKSRKNGLAPLSVIGSELTGIEYQLPVASAQVKSALMLAGLYADSETVIMEPVFTRDHTERLFEFYGIKFSRNGKRIVVYPDGNFKGRRIDVPNDISSAAFFVVLGLISATKELILKDTGINLLRCGIIEVLKGVGADITTENHRMCAGEPAADIIVKKSELEPFYIAGALVPKLIDEIPVLTVLATQINGKSIINDAQELRLKETDRIKAITTELKKLGADIEERDDGLVINGPSKLKGCICCSYNDHRIAMALAIAGLIAEGETMIKNVDCISISFPSFIKLLKQIAGDEYVSTNN